MLVVSKISQAENRRRLVAELRRLRIPLCLVVERGDLDLQSISWRQFWKPCERYFAADTRLVQRLNRLKSAWKELVQTPGSQRRRIAYCWRYFGLLHYALEVARSEPWRGDPLPILHRIIAFQTFRVETPGQPGRCAGVFSPTNPLFLLARMPPTPPLPTPRHVPLVLPLEERYPYYHYRQFQLNEERGARLLVLPSTNQPDQSESFSCIDRLARLLSKKPDPYWRERSRLFAQRILAPTFEQLIRRRAAGRASRVLSVLDLGAGTGHFGIRAWRNLQELIPQARRFSAAFHFIDASEPTFGRSFGVARRSEDIAHVEWTRADFRALLDDDDWLASNGPFDYAFLCRTLDSSSNFLFEQVETANDEALCNQSTCAPHVCLAPRHASRGARNLSVRTRRRIWRGGTMMQQLSLSEYFHAMRAVVEGELDEVDADSPMVAVRRFNPASLLTTSGRSILAQLLRATAVVVIQDLDLAPNHLRLHKEQFGLGGAAGVLCTGDGYKTEARHYVVGSGELVSTLKGERLW